MKKIALLALVLALLVGALYTLARFDIRVANVLPYPQNFSFWNQTFNVAVGPDWGINMRLDKSLMTDLGDGFFIATTNDQFTIFTGDPDQPTILLDASFIWDKNEWGYTYYDEAGKPYRGEYPLMIGQKRLDVSYNGKSGFLLLEPTIYGLRLYWDSE